MKNHSTVVWLGGVMLAIALPAHAEYINPYTLPAGTTVGFNPYATKCEGSIDGWGTTTCELLGTPGTVGFAFTFSSFGDWGPLWSITARPPIDMVKNADGSLTYRNEFDEFNSSLNPQQFAYWEDENRVVVGVEDLPNGDWDYNDFVVEFQKPERPSVPEPNPVVLVVAALVGFARRWWKREIF